MSYSVPCPYGQLWIYEVDGRLPAHPPDPVSGFLGCWLEGGSAFLFFDRPAGPEAVRLAAGAPIRDQHLLSYQDWQGGEAIAPFQVGPFAFRPPWAEAGPPFLASGQREILLDPGLVFGSGNHPTTRHCLAALARLVESGAPAKAALDLGCGTGVLSLAAARLGWRVTAVDLNPLCVQTTARNVELNGLAGRVEAGVGDALDYVDQPGELLLANLEADLIARFIAAGGLARRRWLILSGLTRSREGRIRDLAQAAGFGLIQAWSDQATWFTFLLGRGDDAPGQA
jgi:ribosomal protein L11 methyltransferase